MEFTNAPMRWENAGTEPPEDLKDSGWQANQKPPANYFNAKWRKDYAVQKELQDKLSDVDTALNEHFNANNPHKAVEIAANTDLDDIEDEGYYWCTSSNASSVTNKPNGITFFSLRVSKISGGVFSQEITTAWNRKFIRIHWSGDWSEWVKFSTDDHTHSLTDQDITGILPVSKGGTGATSAEEARANLGLGNVQEALNGRLPFGICTTSGNVQTKTVMIPEYTVTDGSWFLLKFTEDNTWTSSVFLSVNGQSGDVYFGSPDSTSGQFSDISADTLYLVYFNEGDVTFYFTDLSVEITPKEGSTSLITSGGVYSALQGKANSSHNHSASQITSGTLPIARGGTGGTTAAAARTNLGLASVASSGNYDDLYKKPYTVVSTVSELQAAVSTTSQGGKVFLLPGTYEINSIIEVGKSGVVIEGAGINTVLKMGANGYVQFFGDYSILRDVCITRNVASSNPLVVFDGSTTKGGYAKGVLIDNVYINCTKNNAKYGFFKTVGLTGTGVGDGLKFNACTMITDESNAFIYTSGASSDVSVIVSNCVSSENLIVPPDGTILGANINITVG